MPLLSQTKYNLVHPLQRALKLFLEEPPHEQTLGPRFLSSTNSFIINTFFGHVRSDELPSGTSSQGRKRA